jgi:hypothetical protein
VSELARVKARFQRLGQDPSCTITSPTDPQYNCIAWAAEDSTHWWWPVPPGLVPTRAGVYWPPGVPQTGALSDFQEAFELRGYEVCSEIAHEPGFLKVAFYVDASGDPTHAARELPSGEWTSKLGDWVDVTHGNPDGVGGTSGYGTVALVMRRSTGGTH